MVSKFHLSCWFSLEHCGLLSGSLNEYNVHFHEHQVKEQKKLVCGFRSQKSVYLVGRKKWHDGISRVDENVLYFVFCDDYKDVYNCQLLSN
jgi:hypothetical protein